GPGLQTSTVAEADEGERIPAARAELSLAETPRDLGCLSRQIGEHRMPAGFAEPIRGIARIRFLTMQNCVPQLAFRSFAVVGQFVCFLETGKIKPQPGHG